MKNPGVKALALLTALFLSFLSGFFLGRNVRSQPVTVEARQTEPAANATEAPAQTESLAAQSTEAAEVTLPGQTEESIPVSGGKVNVNTASLEELMTLPGIGEVLGQRIIDYREANGPFSTLEELTEVSGIGEKRLEALREYATTGG